MIGWFHCLWAVARRRDGRELLRSWRPEKREREGGKEGGGERKERERESMVPG
jgi:hypothetical protein